jgi:predicted lipoprotein with Yx(FWY)xxD motif
MSLNTLGTVGSRWALLAAHAAVAMASPQREEHLVHAMATRDLIGQAKGILMERYKIARSADNNRCADGWPPPIVG